MASTDFKKNDYLVEKATNVIYFIVKKDDCNMIIRREKDDNLAEYPIHFINSYFDIINYKTAMLLYSDENQLVSMDNRPKGNPINMAGKKLKNAMRALKGELK